MGGLTMEKEDLTTLHDKLADITCVLHGLEIGIKSRQGGNKDQQESLLALKDYIYSRTVESKRIIQREISKEA